MILFKRLYSWMFNKNNIQEQVHNILDNEINHHGNEQERSIIYNILSVTNKVLDDVMIPRADIVGLDIQASQDVIMETVLETQHTRFPVYDGNLDNTIGTVHIKDIFAQSQKGKGPINLKHLMHEPIFVAPTMRVLDLLLLMRVNGYHLAFIVDEYGGVDGQVTINDLIEEIIGDIHDEYQVHDDDIVECGDDSYLISGQVELEELRDLYPSIFNNGTINDINEDIETLGGFVTYLANHVPMQKEIIQFSDGGVEFEIKNSDPRHVKKLLMRPLNNTAIL